MQIWLNLFLIIIFVFCSVVHLVIQCHSRLRAVLLLVLLALLRLRKVVGLCVHFLLCRDALLEHHVIDVIHQLVLVGVKHVFIIIVVVVPCFWIARVVLCKNKDNIVLLESCFLVWVGHDVVDFFADDVLNFFRVESFSDVKTLAELFLIDLEVDFCSSVETHGDHEHSCCKVVK
jgi:hypothetical protein